MTTTDRYDLTGYGTTKTADRMAAFLAYLQAQPLPSPALVSFSRFDRYISVQMDSTDNARTVAFLLAWADTLADVTAEAVAIKTNDSVHVAVIGRANGVTIRAYTGVQPSQDLRDELGLAPGDRTSITLATLRRIHARYSATSDKPDSPS